MSEPYVTPRFIGDQSGGTGVTPAGWLRDNIRAWFNGSIASIMRGEPAPLSKRDAYPTGRSPVKQPAPNGNFSLLLTRRFDRGAYAYGYRFGAMTYDPIGGGVVTTRPLPVEQPAALQIPFGDALYWEPQSINYGVQPTTGPILTPQQAAALMGNEALAAALPNVEYVAPEENGFAG